MQHATCMQQFELWRKLFTLPLTDLCFFITSSFYLVMFIKLLCSSSIRETHRNHFQSWLREKNWQWNYFSRINIGRILINFRKSCFYKNIYFIFSKSPPEFVEPILRSKSLKAFLYIRYFKVWFADLLFGGNEISIFLKFNSSE